MRPTKIIIRFNIALWIHWIPSVLYVLRRHIITYIFVKDRTKHSEYQIVTLFCITLGNNFATF